MRRGRTGLGSLHLAACSDRPECPYRRWSAGRRVSDRHAPGVAGPPLSEVVKFCPNKRSIVCHTRDSRFASVANVPQQGEKCPLYVAALAIPRSQRYIEHISRSELSA